MKKLFLSNGGYCIVSNEDYQALSEDSWHRSSNGYILRNKDLAKMHRVVLGTKAGEIVDHINGVKDDNRKENLRIITREGNVHNMPKFKSVVNTYKGTKYNKRSGYWESRCRMLGQDFHLGSFKTELAAGWAYEKKALELSKFYRCQEFPYSDEEMDTIMKRDRLIPRKAKFKSEYPCVYYNKRNKNKKWVAIVRVDKKNKSIGSFETEIEAYEAVLKFKKKIK